jgi:hypothetical protein
MDRTDWWRRLPSEDLAGLQDIWIPVGTPGYAGPEKARWRRLLDERFTRDGWRIAHIVRGALVPVSVAIADYEASYRRYLRDRPGLVRFMSAACGNVYDYDVSNVHDDDYDQPDTDMNHYQDISVRRVIAELVDDPAWPDVTDTPSETVRLTDLTTGLAHDLPRARGFRGDQLLQIRDPLSPGYMLNPAVVPVHDPTLISSLPDRVDWYHGEGSAHLSVEAFWQMSKVVEVRLDRFLELGDARLAPLADL